MDTSDSVSESQEFGEGSCSTSSPSNEVWDLAWAVLDGIASEEQVVRLRDLVETEHDCRVEYLNAVQLSADLDLIYRKNLDPSNMDPAVVSPFGFPVQTPTHLPSQTA